MKRRSIACTILALLSGALVSPAATLINSWENSLEGWSIIETNTWTSLGFVTSNNTQGSYSWKLSTTGVDYGDTLQGPSSTNLTSTMANAASVSLDMVINPAAPHFNWGIQIDLAVNQPGGMGYMSVTGNNYPGIFGDALTNGSTNTIVFTVSQAVRTALDSYPSLPCYLILKVGGGGGGGICIDNLRANLIPQVQGSVWVRELWDGIGSVGELIPANVAVSNLSSTVGFSTAPWAVNQAQTNNCTLMAFRTLSTDEPVVGVQKFGLPSTLDGSFGCLVQENNGFGFFPGAGGKSFWTDGDFMARPLDPSCYINFQAAGEYWFSATISDRPWDGSAGSLYSQYVVFPSSGSGGFGFANGPTTNADFVAIGATGLNFYYGPAGETNASKALYISQGTLGQPGNEGTTLSAGTNTYTASTSTGNQLYSQTNYSGGPYHINALAANTVGHLSGDYIVLLGHLKTFGNGTATIDAKYYGVGVGGSPWNTDLDTNANNITWDASYSFSYNGTMTHMLLFENGQFPFYIYGFRASTNFVNVVGLDPGYITAAPLANTYVGYPINMTNLAIEANSYSWAPATIPAGYGTLNYQWYKNGSVIGGATSVGYNIASASLGDAGTYTCVATDPSGTWGSVSNSVVITVTQLANPQLTGITPLHNQSTFLLTFNEPNLNGLGDPTHYVFNNGVVISNVTVVNKSTSSEVEIQTSRLPLGTKLSLTITGVTNVVGGLLGTTNLSFWTDLVQAGAANWDGWQYPGNPLGTYAQNDYFNNFVPANPNPYILQSAALGSFDGPSTGVTIPGTDGYTGDGFGGKLYGWFVPPVTTNYVFYISCDDGGRLSLSTNDSPDNLRVIACDSLWNGPNQWTNICDQYPGPGSPHRGDGTATNPASTSGYVWDNSVAGQSPATACLQNRSDQFIVAYYDSTGAPGGPPGATNQQMWSTKAASQVYYCILPAMTNNFWPNRDVYGQALISLQAGKMYYLQLENEQQGGGYNEAVTYKIAGTPDPLSPSTTALSGSVIAGTVAFKPSVNIALKQTGPVITYTGVLLAGTNLNQITNVVAQSSAATAISLGGPSQYTPSPTSTRMFYRTSE
jgi:hypothetical protein